jgi:hypothetical protein
MKEIKFNTTAKKERDRKNTIQRTKIPKRNHY